MESSCCQLPLVYRGGTRWACSGCGAPVDAPRIDLAKHLVAAWSAGHVAGRHNVPARQGAEDYARIVMPIIATELCAVHAGGATSPAVDGCGVCPLPARAHDPAVGIAGHEFEASTLCVECRAMGCSARNARCEGGCPSRCHTRAAARSGREAEPIGVT